MRTCFGILGDDGGTAGETRDCLRDPDLLGKPFVGLPWDEACVAKDEAVGVASVLLTGVVAATAVIVVGFCIFSGRPFIQEVRGLENAVVVDVFFCMSLPRNCSSTFSAALALLARCD